MMTLHSPFVAVPSWRRQQRQEQRAGLAAVLVATVALLSEGARAAEKTVSTYDVTFRMVSLAPPKGTCLSPFWIGIHDGTFDFFDFSEPASLELERLVEDSNPIPMRLAFQQAFAADDESDTDDFDGAHDALAGIPHKGYICSGETASVTLKGIKVTTGEPQYFSYASMVLPSNDAFIGNDDADEILLFDEGGSFVFEDFEVFGEEVLDAGTEINDEIPAHTPLLGQTKANEGLAESGGVVDFHDGFLSQGEILSHPQFSDADFSSLQYRMVRIEAEATFHGSETVQVADEVAAKNDHSHESQKDILNEKAQALAISLPIVGVVLLACGYFVMYVLQSRYEKNFDFDDSAKGFTSSEIRLGGIE